MFKHLSVRPVTNLLLVSFLILILGINTGCQYIIENIQKYLDAAHELWNFNGAVLIAWKGRLVVNRGYGYANEQLKIPNSPQTKFFIGSLTKQFTASLILILEHEGKLNLSDPVGKYIDGFREEVAAGVTIHHLLTHSSGLPDYVSQPEIYWNRGEPFDTDELINSVKSLKTVFRPGTDFLYSNSGYLILGAIIEKISGQSYEAFLHHRILKPLNMYNTGYGRREAAHPNRADGYSIGEFGQVLEAMPVDFSVLHSAGAMYSTVEDMLKWERSFFNNRILPVKTWSRMFIPYIRNYGYGWFIGSRFDQIHHYHEGLIDGFNSYIDRWPGVGLTIIVFSNDDFAPVEKIGRALAAICFARDYEAPIKKSPIAYDYKLYADFRGVYKGDDGEYIIVNYDDSVIYTRLISTPKTEILPHAIDTFFFDFDNTKTIVFYRSNKEVISCEINDDGEKKLMYRLSDKEADRILIKRNRIEVDPRILKRYVGQYLLESDIDLKGPRFLLNVYSQDSRLFIATDENDRVELYPNSPEEFFHPLGDLSLTFIRNELGVIEGCMLRQGLAEIYGEKIN